MKILSLNTWQERGPWQERWKITFRWLEAHSPDFCAFQEVFKESWAREIQRKTGNKSLVFFPEPSGLAMVSRYPVKRSEILKYQTQSPIEDYKRFAVFAEFETPAGAVYGFNTHLSWKPADSATRAGQIRELIDWSREKANGNPVFVTGDFNASPETAEVRQMTEAGFMDTFTAMNPGKPGLTWDNQNPYAAGASVFLPDRRIDYVFTRDFMKIADLGSSEVVLKEPNENRVFASDHYGVLSEFKLRRQDGRG